ncbi:hypothetical protein [Chengkuizengella axinellae]|uniref:DUF4489 domain-containing protein n=1 Tax=Chengkuizengella axinellae TaxID=3064388 RepID=A0ABT9IXI6_9BACL|nr:hypothetical protein [Chengkuizengella sp. 2205SS18-9]MDP5274023.1 hypothetical protein [Chengkuizengella sp. 2205SS18-9]
MGLDRVPFIVADTVSVDDPYTFDPNVIQLPFDGTPVDVLSVDVCVSHKTQIKLDTMAQIAVLGLTMIDQTFEVTYQIIRNDDCVSMISDEMDYDSVVDGRHMNFPNFPLVDKNPSLGMNTYHLRCTSVITPTVGFVFVGSRSLKATVFTL